MKRIAQSSTVLLLAFFCVMASAQTALKLLPFQGRLTDQNGTAVSNGVRLVQFKIYDVPTGGSPVWAGELHRTTVNSGLVNVMLGTKTPFSEVDFDRQLYLEITVDVSGPTGQPDNSITAADPPMLPRQAVLPVIFAKEAADSRLLDGYDWNAIFAEGATNPPSAKFSGVRLASQSVTAAQIASNSITSDRMAVTERISAGTIMMHHTFGGAAPISRGWMKCNGSIVNQPNYDGLHGVGAFVQDGIAASVILGRNLPNLVNRYPVGVINTSSDGNSAIPSVGNAGNTVNLSHTHPVPTHNHQWIAQDSIHGTSYSLISYNSAGQGVGFAFSQPSSGNRMVVQNSSGGITGDYYTGVNSGPFDTGNSSIGVTSVKPDSIEVIFIIKVK